MKPCVLITGASSGIGREIARLYSRKGFETWLVGRNQPRLEETAQKMEGPSKIFLCDLTRSDQVEDLSREIAKSAQGKSLQGLIHNAGWIRRAPFIESTREDWQESFQVHLLSPVLLTQGLLPLLTASPEAFIVNVSSTLAIKPILNTSSYSALKAAMINWTKSLALELADRKIRVNAVAPGIVQTPIHGEWSAETKSQMDQLQPLQRVGTPQEIAKSVYFLGSNESPWTTGSVLTVDGGISLL